MRELIKGNTPEERQKSMEAVLRRMQGRMHKTVYVLSPPMVDSGYKEVVALGESFLGFLFPYNGKIKHCLLYLEDEKVESVEVEICLKSATSVQSRLVRIKPMRLRKEVLDMDVKEGDKLIFSLITAISTERNVIPQSVIKLSGSFFADISPEYMKSSHKQIDDLLAEE